MADFAYTTVPGKIKKILEKIRQVGVPAKVNRVWMKTVGFTSSNDSSLISVLKFLGLIDSSGVPTQVWSQYRGNNHKKILGSAIRSGYAELFSVYADANKRNQSELEHVFKTSTSAGNQAISKTVATFKALVEEADFSNESGLEETVLSATPLHVPVIEGQPRQVRGVEVGESNPSLHIDIQIHISPESSAEQIDLIFSSMKKHLYGKKN